MIRNARCGGGARFLACLTMILGVPGAAGAVPLISEVFYDAVGSDDAQSFVELYAPPGFDLAGLTLEGVNGSNGSVGPVIALSGIVPPDGLYVVADVDSGGGTSVAMWDQLANFDFQNGPDSIELRDGMAVLDALAYGVFDADEFPAGEGVPAPDAPSGQSLARVFADLDTGDNSVDFTIVDPNPGEAVVVPEPGAASLATFGLLALAWLSRDRGHAR